MTYNFDEIVSRRGTITNIKNPITGRIVCDGVGSVTIDEHVLQPNNCEIVVRS